MAALVPLTVWSSDTIRASESWCTRSARSRDGARRPETNRCTGGGSPAYGTGGGLARTGSRTSAEIGLAGLAVALGGLLLFAGQPRWARAGK